MKKWPLVVIMIFLISLSSVIAISNLKSGVKENKINRNEIVKKFLNKSIWEDDYERVIVSFKERPLFVNTRLELKGAEVVHEFGKLKDKAVIKIK